MLEYNLFRGAKIEFPEANILKMELAKTTLGEDAADELIRILYKIFTERCGLDVKIQVEFVDKKEEKKKRSGRADVEKQAEALNAAMWAAKQAADAAEGAENAESAGGNGTAAGDVGSSGGMKTEKKPAAASTRRPRRNFGNFGKSEYAYGKTLRSGGGFLKPVAPATILTCFTVVILTTASSSIWCRSSEKWARWSSTAR